MPQLGFRVEFLTEFAKLEPPIRKRTVEALEKFGEHTHAGLHLEKLTGVRDDRVRTIRITDYWRGVVLAPTSGDRYLLLRVLGHDEAIEWARRRQFSVNEVSGVLEMRDVTALEELAAEALPARAQLFAHVSDGDLRKLGIDVQVLAAARIIADEDELDKIAPLLPEAQGEVLYGLASGMSVEDVWADIVAPRIPAEPIDVHDLAAAAERSQGRVALVDGPDELLALFEKPFALWRVFLHPSQEKVAYRPSYWGSAQVTGGPGTGKTVAALHRVKHLVSTRDLSPRSVLVTTFSRPLAQALDRDLAQLLEPAERQAVEVINIDRWAHGVVRAEHGPLRMATEDELAGFMRDAATAAGMHYSPTFLLDEWRQVVLGGDLHDARSYLQTSRRGRGQRLTAKRKYQLWDVFESFTSRLRDSGGWTHLTVAEEATRLLSGRARPPYRHIVVDEIQDLHPVQWRLLRAAVPVGPDDLFLAGDPHQRIYGNRVSLRQVGISVTGRSTRLRINYRTSAEILDWALGILGDTAVADLDEGLDTLAGYRSTLHGEPPELAAATSPEQEREELRAALHRWHADGVAWRDMAVVGRTGRIAKQATHRLDVATSELHGGPDDAVRVGTMHGMKGMEFRCVAVVGAGRTELPNLRAVTPTSDDPVRNALDLQQERCLLFVACTRARERLRVSWTGAPSDFLPDQAAGS